MTMTTDPRALVERAKTMTDRTAGVGRGVREARDPLATTSISVKELLAIETFIDEAAATITRLTEEVEAASKALDAVAGAMLMGGDGAVGDFGWNIGKLNRARPLIRAARAQLDREGGR